MMQRSKHICTYLIICMLVIMNAFLSSADLKDKILEEYYLSVKQFGSRSGLHFVGHDMGPNCLQRISAEDKSHH